MDPVYVNAQVGVAGYKIGWINALKTTTKLHGAAGYFRGFDTALFRCIPNVAIQWSVYSTLVPLLDSVDRRAIGTAQPPYLSMAITGIAGAFGGIAGQLVTHPLDVVKVRQQVATVKAHHFRDVMDGLGAIGAREGITGLYRGLVPSLMGAAVYSGLFFLYLDMAENLPWRRGRKSKEISPFIYLEWLLVPVAFGASAYAAAYPFDTIRHKVMANTSLLKNHGAGDVPFKNYVQLYVNMTRLHGLSGLFQGLSFNAAKAMPQITSDTFSAVIAHVDSDFMCELANELIRLEGTAPTGLENSAIGELRDKGLLHVCPACSPVKQQGHVFFAIEKDNLKHLVDLRSFDNLFAVVYKNDEFGFADTEERVFEQTREVISSSDWTTALTAWQSFTSLSCSAEHSIDAMLKNVKAYCASADRNTSLADVPIKFRATCYRSGNGHCFTSQTLQSALGGSLQNAFRLAVDLKHYDMDIVINVLFNQFWISIALTRSSMHRRNMTEFGCTTLRATICYGLLRLGAPKIGDVILDPMCGSGAIIAEAAHAYPHCVLIAADNYEPIMPKCAANLNQKASALCWDTTCCPLRSGCADVIVTDLPFGKRLGSKMDNRLLYPRVLKELARIATPVSGRAVFLTADLRSFIKASQATSRWWKLGNQLRTNVGGIKAAVFILRRTDLPFV